MHDVKDQKNRIISSLLIVIFLSYACSTEKKKPPNMEHENQKTTVIDFWNGNRSAARQVYEREVLKAIVEATEHQYGKCEVKESLVDYPGKEESLAFSKYQHDVLITVAGNQKFKEGDMIVIPQPLTKNLLGYRIPIIRAEDEAKFSQITNKQELQKLSHGIPETWSDATVFRHNHFNVVENGNFDAIFERLQNNEFDYCTFGANEVLEIHTNRAAKQNNLIIEQNLLLFYPFPLVFYVHPNKPHIAERIEKGLQNIMASGQLDSIFDAHYGDIKKQLNLKKRTLITLKNPLLPDGLNNFVPNLEQL